MLPPSDELHLSGGDPLARRDLPNTSTPARASRPGARAAHGPGAAADVRRFDEQACSGRGCPAHRRARALRPSPTRAKDKSSWEGAEHRSRRGPHHTDRAASVTMGSSHPGWATILPRPGCLDLGQTEDRRLIAELRNDLHADGQPLRAPSAATGSRPGGRMR